MQISMAIGAREAKGQSKAVESVKGISSEEFQQFL